MLVEDDASVRNLVQVMLEAKGYRVLAANGAEEAERLCTSAVDLLLTDVIMPEVNGRSLAERLATTAPAMRILFMSGYSDEAVLPPRRAQPGRGVHREAVLGPRAGAQGPRGARRLAARGRRAGGAARR